MKYFILASAAFLASCSTAPATAEDSLFGPSGASKNSQTVNEPVSRRSLSDPYMVTIKNDKAKNPITSCLKETVPEAVLSGGLMAAGEPVLLITGGLYYAVSYTWCYFDTKAEEAIEIDMTSVAQETARQVNADLDSKYETFTKLKDDIDRLRLEYSRLSKDSSLQLNSQKDLLSAHAKRLLQLIDAKEAEIKNLKYIIKEETSTEIVPRLQELEKNDRSTRE